MTTVPTRLGRLAVHEYGAGPVAVLWHSMFVDSSSWGRVLAPLGEHRRLVVIDGPGYGDSDELVRMTTIAQCAAAALEVLDGLGIQDPVDWVGNAWGGHIGYQLAGRHPERLRSLVAISAPLSGLARRERMKLRVLRPALRGLGPRAVFVSMVADAQLTDYSRAADDEAVSIIRNSMGRQSRRSLSTTLGSFVIRRGDLTAVVKDATVRALFVASDDHGEWSPAAAAQAAAMLPNARAVTVSWARTLVPVEQPRQLAAHIVEFWNEEP